MHLVKLIKNDKMSKSKVHVEENLGKKILRHINSVKEGIGEFSENKNEFGEVAAKVILRRKCNMISAEEYIDFMSKYMLKELDSMLKQYKKSPQIVGKNKGKNELEKYPVWLCWLQGEEYLPEICKKCVDNIKQKLPYKAEVIFLTYENYLSYIDIPEDIVQKHMEGKINPTNYTDIIRYGLLAKYGGAWIDSSIYFSGDILDNVLAYEIYSPKFENERLEDASRGKWVGGCWFSQKGNTLFKFTYDSLLYFWRKHNKAIDYLAADYILWTGYTELEEAKKLIDSIPIDNENIRLLNNYLYETYDQHLYQEILKKNQIHILNRHPNYPCYDDNGKETFYGHLVNGI